jgi:hypothetical protein
MQTRTLKGTNVIFRVVSPLIETSGFRAHDDRLSIFKFEEFDMQKLTLEYLTTEDGDSLFIMTDGDTGYIKADFIHFRETWGQYDFRQPRTLYRVETHNGLFTLCKDLTTGAYRFVDVDCH